MKTFRVTSLMIVSLCVNYASPYALQRAQVTIDQGTLQGTTLETDDGYLQDVYYAIPFAAPPVGKLRFKAPEPPLSWQGVRDATEFGAECFQIIYPETMTFTGEEDCLFLNVYTPSQVYNKSNLSVMFWIHGGAMSVGSANTYTGKFLVENDVVVVTTNYRPGFTGFMALGNADVPGNAGLKDLVMALEWVEKNIHHFGGDPDKVTIFGESAGGALTHFLIMSSLTTGLFDKAISQSGVSNNEWPIQEDPQSIASQLFSLTGVHTDDSYDLLNVLWNIPIELVGLIANQIPLDDGRLTAFRPVIEGEYSSNAFIRDHPRDLMEGGQFNHVPTLSGFTSQEGLLFLSYTNYHNPQTVEDIVPDFSFYIPAVIRDLLSAEEKVDVMQKIRDFYFPPGADLIESYIDLNSDHQFIKDIDVSTRFFAKYEPNTYYYQFTYNGAYNMFKYMIDYNYTGAAHGDELGYLVLEIPSFIPATDQDRLVRSRIVKMWANFAKFGNPTPEMTEDIDVLWRPVSEDEVNCMNIGSELVLEVNPLQERLQFWRDLEDSYV